MPDFLGKTRQQAADLAGSLGLYILVSGNPDAEAGVTAIAQDIEAGTQVRAGTTITIRFANGSAED